MTATADIGTPEIHHKHRDVTGGWLRPATFGVVDGLVSNFALVAGVVGGGAGAHAVVLTGLAGLTAGACSMATGEYISVTSQNELAQAEIAREQRELATNPEEELRELTLAYEAKGVRPELAAEIATALTADPDVALRVHVREELGVDPDDLPSGWSAAASSFAAFALGALLPLLPFVFGASDIAPALVASSAGLVVTGALTAKLTASSGWFGASRQLLLGGVSAAVTFGVGLLVGTGVS
ncbi:VIT1/CCC1 transporter family protein [Streptomyces cocklensis]|uniref:Predicted Fe2+/Mn2+ transporter, VIT1/CCC1 family n=1 Tax=Actinacidiphila cocklensis TaxID=887465 RepID=A0A9W4DK63_9ACTN|nr:VIT1/CCC1 transporter family protein [Actinacidiphila cocklensis]MDD1062001.1 VIT1/CCC1 transporter family protein [Actinacidiphila cocklensis]CAG6391203.1 Predicted Fe2+/Mn2+ transporter, VIT1/CCC1 family [Actinacidiphila cocklensis]